MLKCKGLELNLEKVPKTLGDLDGIGALKFKTGIKEKKKMMLWKHIICFCVCLEVLQAMNILLVYIPRTAPQWSVQYLYPIQSK